MNANAKTAISILVVAALAAGAGFWLGGRGPATATGGQVAAADGKSDQVPTKKVRKLLYYRNPMGLADTSPTPKKDPMGMDYIAVYDGEEDGNAPAAGQVRISIEKVQKLGVKTEAASRRSIAKQVRAAGRIEPDERRTYTISPKFEGYVERLYVNVTGQVVNRGQPLFEMYSPDLVSAQREYAIAAKAAMALKSAGSEAQGGMKSLADSSLARLKNWDISAEQIKALAETGEAKRSLTFLSPVSGIVTEKKAVQGMRFMPGEALYQVTDLSSIWLVADVFEQDIGQVQKGAKVTVTVNAYPEKTFAAIVSYIYPTLKPETRTVQIRAELANPGHLLKPGMYVQVELAATSSGKAITIPNSAVIDSGTRQLVFVQVGEGRFEPRAVKLGGRGDSFVEVLDGVKEGEQVVTTANFLIDAESNLTAAIGGFAQAPATAAKVDAGKAPAGSKASHLADGVIDGIDAAGGSMDIQHGPVASVNWPAMTMQFKLANPALATGLRKGATVSFEFVERQQGEWVITAIRPAASSAVTAPAKPVETHRSH